MDFAALFPRHAFVDLETTGLDPAQDRVIELGVLFVERGEVVQRVSKLFDAGGPLPLAIQRLTGLSDAQLAGAPPFASELPALSDALRGYTVIAHNAGFELGFLGELLRGIDAPVLDSMELLHYLYPELPSHSLESTLRWAGVGEHAQHRALHDCEDTHAVLRHALARLVREGRGGDVTELLACLAPPGCAEPEPPLVTLLRALEETCGRHRAELTLEPTSRHRVSHPEWLRRSALPPRPLEEPAEVTPAPVEEAELDALLGPGGALERSAPGFSSRPAQREMARALARTLHQGGTLAVEAATGTGKSLGYLAPAVLFATKNQLRVGVAPHTKTLQDQLVEKELPALHRATGGAFGYAVLKGQTNYACLRRMLEATAPAPSQPYEERAARAYLRAFLRRSPDGDLDRLSFWFRGRFPAVAALALAGRSESATTLGERCPHFARCFYHSAVAQAKEADVVVINQALALAWPARYPHVRHLIVDEAHELEDVISTALARELSGAVLARVGERLSGLPGRRGLLSELQRAVSGGGEARAWLVEAAHETAQLAQDAAALGPAVQALCAAVPEEAEKPASYAREVRLTPPVRALPEWALLLHALEELREGLDALAKRLGTPPQAISEGGALAATRELAGVTAELTELAALARALGEPPPASECHFAVERQGKWQLISAPVDAGALFRDELAAKQRALVLTSATLSTGPQRPWVLERLGMRAGTERAAPILRARTPFNLRAQALVVLVTDAPDPNDDAFLEWSAARISGLAQFMNGRVLGLFASSRRLAEVGERVRATLEPAGIEVLRQSRGHGHSLAARQEQDKGSVLLGTKSFWQGVDIRGAGVACVFIDKLPIEPHTRPLVAAREERMGEGRTAGFMQYRLPKALILLRQGVGRLIRSTSDRGVVIIADPGSATYRREVYAALDGYRVEALPWALARRRLFHQLRAMALHAGAARQPLPGTPPARRLEPRATLG